MEDYLPIINRLKKRFTHLSKWAKIEDTTAYRLYDKDIPEFPLIIDVYGQYWIIWTYSDPTYSIENLVILLTKTFDKNEDLFIIKSNLRQKGQQDYSTKKSKMTYIQESGLSFEINLSDYLDVGLFLDHRRTRRFIKEKSYGKSVLNLFSYTGSFTCYAIDGGACETTSVDLSKTYCEWAMRNIENNFNNNTNNRVIERDVLQFLKEECSINRKYEIIICDPPSFSNSKKSNVNDFSINADYVELLTHCLSLLSKSGLLIFSTNSRSFKLDNSQLPSNINIQELTPETIPDDFRNKKIHRCWSIQHLLR